MAGITMLYAMAGEPEHRSEPRGASGQVQVGTSKATVHSQVAATS